MTRGQPAILVAMMCGVVEFLAPLRWQRTFLATVVYVSFFHTILHKVLRSL